MSQSPSTISSSGLTQVPTSATDILLGYGISDRMAEELNVRHNRRSIPIMSDEQFFEILSKFAAEGWLTAVETKLQLHID